MSLIPGSSAVPYVPPPIGYIRGFQHHKNPSAQQWQCLPGAIEINRVIYYLNAGISIARPGITSWNYIYINKPASGGNVLSSSEFSFSATAPTFDNTRQGWYDATKLKRCIGWFLDTGAAMHGYTMVNGLWIFDQPQQFAFLSGSMGTAFVSYNVQPPFTGIRWAVWLRGWFGGGSTARYLRAANGDNTTAASNAYAVAYFNGGSEAGFNFPIMTDTSGQVQLSASAASADFVGYLGGLYIPDGFAR